MGYLPYKIEALCADDAISPARIQRAMESVGGVVNKVGREIELRFARQDQAHEAYRELQRTEPGPFWTIVQESSPSEG